MYLESSHAKNRKDGATSHGLAGSTKGAIGSERVNFVLWKRRRDQRGPDRTGCHTVDANLLRRKLRRQSARKREDGTFRRCIVQQQVLTTIGRDRCGVDDLRSFGQVRQGCLYAEKLSESIRPERPHELPFSNILDLVTCLLLSGVVDETVELAELGNDALDCILTK